MGESLSGKAERGPSGIVRMALLLLALSGCAHQAARSADEVPRIAVVTAYEPELQALLPDMQVQATKILNGRTFYLGTLGGKPVVLFQSGISTVNAAMTVQLALSHFQVSHIVVSGIAGGVNPGLHVGDVVIPRQWANYQEQAFAREKAPDSWEVLPFHTQELGHYGMMFPQHTRVVRKDGPPDLAEKRFWFDVDPHLLSVASGLGHRVTLEKCNASQVCLQNTPRLKVGGRGVSGSTFVDNAAYRAWVWDNFQDGSSGGVDALDMETSAVATVAYANGVPFIAFRSLSDLAGGGPGSNEVAAFFGLAASNSARVVRSFLEAL
ncbi:MAG TPA: 5'-methylthioadenosine/S-adenosylhomocysteine nucleosidase [Hyalangium sp.]|nr:5'-methylthioadenosine/S-adenosylhomocysteine nucleosidase [Hyalangium sp.]